MTPKKDWYWVLMLVDDFIRLKIYLHSEANPARGQVVAGVVHGDGIICTVRFRVNLSFDAVLRLGGSKVSVVIRVSGSPVYVGHNFRIERVQHKKVNVHG